MSATDLNEHLYEYAILRYVPRIDREEFINIGLLMMCKRKKWCKAAVSVDENRLEALRPQHSRDEILKQCRTFTLVAEANPDGGPMSALPAEERFRWLTAVKSSAMQTSRPHAGLTCDLEETFERLYRELVL